MVIAFWKLFTIEYQYLKNLLTKAYVNVECHWHNHKSTFKGVGLKRWRVYCLFWVECVLFQMFLKKNIECLVKYLINDIRNRSRINASVTDGIYVYPDMTGRNNCSYRNNVHNGMYWLSNDKSSALLNLANFSNPDCIIIGLCYYLYYSALVRHYFEIYWTYNSSVMVER